MSLASNRLESARGPNLFWWFAVGAFAFLAFSHVRLLQRFNSLSAELHALSLVSPDTSPDLSQPARQEKGLVDPSGSANTRMIGPVLMPEVAQARLALVERRLEELVRSPTVTFGVRAVAEYNVASPPLAAIPDEPREIRLQWGHEQALGPPDTATASDAVTAWTSREPDAGEEMARGRFRESGGRGGSPHSKEL